jgi:hypothetical protein
MRRFSLSSDPEHESQLFVRLSKRGASAKSNFARQTSDEVAEQRQRLFPSLRSCLTHLRMWVLDAYLSLIHTNSKSRSMHLIVISGVCLLYATRVTQGSSNKIVQRVYSPTFSRYSLPLLWPSLRSSFIIIPSNTLPPATWVSGVADKVVLVANCGPRAVTRPLP